MLRRCGQAVAAAALVGACASRAGVRTDAQKTAIAAAPSAAPPAFCQKGQVRVVGERRLCVRPERVSYAEAAALCEADGASFYVPPSRDDEVALAHELRVPGWAAESGWIGLARLGERQFRWVDGRELGPARWAPGEPNNAGGTERCAHLLAGAVEWNDIPCGVAMPFWCELPREEPIAVGQLRPYRCAGRILTMARGDICWHFTPLSWDDAHDACRDAGGRLLTLATEQEQIEFLDVALGRVAARSIWIGLSDEGHEGAFVEADGSPPKAPHWRQGEPNNAGGVENCVELYSDGTGWNDLPCDSLRSFVCAER